MILGGIPVCSALCDKRKARGIPGDHAAAELPDVRVTRLDEIPGGLSAHVSDAAVDDDLRTLVGGQFAEPLEDLVVREVLIGPFDFAFEWYVDVDEGEVLVLEHRLEFGGGNPSEGAPVDRHRLSDAGGVVRLIVTGVSTSASGGEDCDCDDSDERNEETARPRATASVLAIQERTSLSIRNRASHSIVSLAWRPPSVPEGGEKKWSGRRDSNPRPPPWQGGALPLSHFRSPYHYSAGATARKTPS